MSSLLLARGLKSTIVALHSSIRGFIKRPRMSLNHSTVCQAVSCRPNLPPWQIAKPNLISDQGIFATLFVQPARRLGLTMHGGLNCCQRAFDIYLLLRRHCAYVYVGVWRTLSRHLNVPRASASVGRTLFKVFSRLGRPLSPCVVTSAPFFAF